ncbi:MAG: beta-galactosidase [Acidobacteriota bacterium]
MPRTAIKVFACTALIALALAAGVARSEDTVSTSTSPGWKTMEENGRHWLLTPEGKRFYSKGVNIVTPGAETEKSLLKQAYCWKNFCPTMNDWCRTVSSQLGSWGFNTRGGWSDPSPDIDLALTIDLELGRNSQFHWFDPFHPDMEEKILETALKLTAPYRDNPKVLGYYTDNEVGWWNSPLFTWYLQADWETNHTKRKLCEVILDHYQGSWDRFLEDWVPQGNIAGFEDLKRPGAALKLRPGGRGILLVDRFMQVYVRRYYETMSKAIRQTHPGVLVLGDRMPLYYHQDAVLAIGDTLDAIATNYNVDSPDGWVAPYYFDGLRLLTGKPVIVTEFFFAAEENRSGNRNETARNAHPKPGHLMTVETQAERVWGASKALVNFARFPNIVGTHWFQYCDEPFGGRDDGEDYNMGLIDTANRPYEELTEMFRALNPALEHYHQEGRPSVESPENSVVTIPRAKSEIDVTDQSLLDWDKEKTLLHGFQIPKPHVPFGDVHIAWRPEGLYIASIANTFVDPRFIDYKGDFPLSDAFQLHLTVQAQGKASRFAAYLLPEPDPAQPDGFAIHPRLCRLEGDRIVETIPADGSIQRLNKSLPHMLIEAFIPAERLGLKQLEPGMELRLNVALANYYREWTMVWSGEPTLNGEENLKMARKVVLGDDGEGGAVLTERK